MITIACFNVTIALYNKVNIIDKELLNACYTFCHLVFEKKKKKIYTLVARDSFAIPVSHPLVNTLGLMQMNNILQTTFKCLILNNDI